MRSTEESSPCVALKLISFIGDDNISVMFMLYTDKEMNGYIHIGAYIYICTHLEDSCFIFYIHFKFSFKSFLCNTSGIYTHKSDFCKSYVATICLFIRP